MSLHIMGICGTFMGGVAQLARELGIRVRGSDANTYPPMSTLLESLDVQLCNGYRAENLSEDVSEVVVGNAMSRGNPEVEALLDSGLTFSSGPQWLYQNVLRARPTLAVAGTHGKTTTTSMLTWILECAELQPGFLIGGVARDLGCSARLGKGPFVVEADEYDSAFFDKRSKFVHYFPDVLVLNNLEFDHADIFADLDAIKTQFHHLIRCVPASGHLIVNLDDGNLAAVLELGCWTPQMTFSVNSRPEADWSARIDSDSRGFEVLRQGQLVARVDWQLRGHHNVANALAAIAAAHCVGVEAAQSAAALSDFQGVRRRLEQVAQRDGITVLDDFAHHPTAIQTTLEGLRLSTRQGRVIAVLEPRSNSMRQGAHADQLATCLKVADFSFVYSPPALAWDADAVLAPLGNRVSVHGNLDALLSALRKQVTDGDQVVFMSNGSFEGAPLRFAQLLENADEQL